MFYEGLCLFGIVQAGFEPRGGWLRGGLFAPGITTILALDPHHDENQFEKGAQ